MPTDAEFEAAMRRVAARKAKKAEEKKSAADVGRAAGKGMRGRKARIDEILSNATTPDHLKPVR